MNRRLLSLAGVLASAIICFLCCPVTHTEAVVTQKIQNGIDELAAKPNGGRTVLPTGYLSNGYD